MAMVVGAGRGVLRLVSGNRKFESKHSAFTGGGSDSDAASGACGAFLHPENAEARSVERLSLVVQFEAFAIVADFELEYVAHFADKEFHAGSAGVFFAIVKSFLCDSI